MLISNSQIKIILILNNSYSISYEIILLLNLFTKKQKLIQKQPKI